MLPFLQHMTCQRTWTFYHQPSVGEFIFCCSSVIAPERSPILTLMARLLVSPTPFQKTGVSALSVIIDAFNYVLHSCALQSLR